MSYTILVVDDSSVMRGMVRRAITMSGLAVEQILEAGNGREALAVLGSSWIDIVFADLNMPEMTGFELVARMAADPLLSDTPVVIVSSEHSEARAAELSRQGIAAYIKKPFRPEIVREVIHRVLGTQAAARA